MEEKYILKANHKNEIMYMDGGEKYLFKIFKRKKYKDPFDLHRYIKDWPSKYHLTIERIAIIHSIEDLIDKKSKVLELGAGTGAITWYLAQKFKSVDAIEGSSPRASIIKERTKKYNNVNVITADITQLKYPTSYYQLVTLIGVLEYIPYYSKKDKEIAVREFLRNIYRTLDKEGILVIAIENKLGAKYFSGCKEDHNGVMFSGIIDYPFKSPITYSRYELEKILKEAGFENIQFYHLLPDYKLPKLFVKETEEFYDIYPSGIWRGYFKDYSGSRMFLFSDSLFIENTIKSRTFFQFSNSFLVLASKSKTKNLKTKWIIRKYWNDFNIKKEYHHFVDVIKTKDKIKVYKTPLYIEKKYIDNDLLIFKLLDQEWIKGDSIYIRALKALFANDNFSSLKKITKKIGDISVNMFGIGETDMEGFPVLKGEAIDFTYWNIKEDQNNNWHFIDRKWKFKTPLPVDYILFRNLAGLWEECFPFLPNYSKEEFIYHILKDIFPYLYAKRIENYIERERRLHSILSLY